MIKLRATIVNEQEFEDLIELLGTKYTILQVSDAYESNSRSQKFVAKEYM